MEPSGPLRPARPRESKVARLSSSDLAKIPGYVLRPEDKESIISIESMPNVLRTCYLIIAANSIWLLIPTIGLLSGNNIVMVSEALVVAGACLFLSNNYLGKRWYYGQDVAKGTMYESHFETIDNIGFRTFFVSMIGGLIFLITAVFAANLFKSFGPTLVIVLNAVLSLVLIVQAGWILKEVRSGMTKLAQQQPTH